MKSRDGKLYFRIVCVANHLFADIMRNTQQQPRRSHLKMAHIHAPLPSTPRHGWFHLLAFDDSIHSRGFAPTTARHSLPVPSILGMLVLCRELNLLKTSSDAAGLRSTVATNCPIGALQVRGALALLRRLICSALRMKRLPIFINSFSCFSEFDEYQETYEVACSAKEKSPLWRCLTPCLPLQVEQTRDTSTIHCAIIVYTRFHLLAYPCERLVTRPL